MKYQRFSVNDFSAGYNSSSSREAVADGAMLPGSADVKLSSYGGLERRNGYALAVTGTWDVADTDSYTETLGIQQFYEPGTSGTRRLVRLARNGTSCRVEWNSGEFPDTETNIWEDGGGSPVAYGSTTFTSESFADFVSVSFGGQGRLYCAVPSDTAVRYITFSAGTPSVTAVTDNTNHPSLGTLVSKPRGVELWYDRIWTFMDGSHDAGSFLVWSDTDGAAFSADSWLEIVGEGPITGMVRVGRNLVVFKEQSTYVLTGGDDPENRLSLNQLSRDVGCIAHRSIVSVDNVAYFLSERGIFKTDGFRLEFVGASVDNDFNQAQRSNTQRVHGVHNRKDNQVVWWIPVVDPVGSGWGRSEWGNGPWGDGSTYQRGYVYDYEAGAWCAPYTNQPFWCACTYTNAVAATALDDEIVLVSGNTVDHSGKIYQWGTGDTDDGEEVTATAVLKPWDLGDAGRMKIARKAYLKIGEQGADTTVTVKLYKEYGNLGTPADEVTHTTTSGTEEDPDWQLVRKTVGVVSHYVRYVVEMSGKVIFGGIETLFSVKGRRS